MTLESQYKEFLKLNPRADLSFDEWKNINARLIKQAIINMMKDDEELGLYDEPFKHTVEVIPAEEVLANRSNAYEFINIDKMKNIHVLSTDNKLSRLYFNVNDKEFQICEIEKPSTILKPNRHIYITSDEEIKEGDWFTDDNNSLKKSYKLSHVQFANPKKIILTTDDLLIKDGVQAIDDEFLQWFVKNPSCKMVDIGTSLLDGKDGYGYYGKYKIIIPKEEPKKEITLEEKLDKIVSKEPSKFRKESDERFEKKETLEEFIKSYINRIDRSEDGLIEQCLKDAAKWQQKQNGLMEIELNHTKTLLASCEKALEDRDKQAERMYSEEEVYDILIKHTEDLLAGKRILLNEWFEQFKKK